MSSNKIRDSGRTCFFPRFERAAELEDDPSGSMRFFCSRFLRPGRLNNEPSRHRGRRGLPASPHSHQFHFYAVITYLCVIVGVLSVPSSLFSPFTGRHLLAVRADSGICNQPNAHLASLRFLVKQIRERLLTWSRERYHRDRYNVYRYNVYL